MREILQVSMLVYVSGRLIQQLKVMRRPQRWGLSMAELVGILVGIVSRGERGACK
jgi:hypothetical protein